MGILAARCRGPGRGSRRACSRARDRRRRLARRARGRPGASELPEVALAQAVERGAVHLGRAAHVVVDAGLKRLAVLVEPDVLRDVAVLDEHVLGVPVLLLARQPPAALQDEDALAERRQLERQRAAPRAAADDDHVIGLSHGPLPSPTLLRPWLPRRRRAGSRSGSRS